MTNKEYTNEDIISSLELIATTGNCNECKIRNCKWGTCNCSQITAKSALELIGRQKVEIERLKGSVITNTIMESQRIKREAKTEAYKEFAEELTNILRNIPKWNVKKLNFNNVGFSYDDVFFSIENLLKEKIKGDLKPQK